VREYVRQLPIEDRPEVFGLHANAAITFQQKESKTLINTVVLCSGGGGGGGGGGSDNSDSKVYQQAATIYERMPNYFDLNKSHPSTFRKVHNDTMNSLGVFLRQELIRFNGLIEVMLHTLKQLQRAIKGEVVMSSDLEIMYNAFVFQKVPIAWEEAGYPCLKPLASWVEDFLGRISFMLDWLSEGPRNCYWLSGFFFPQGFMTAVKQTYSRDHKIAVDTLRIGCEMTGIDVKDIETAPQFGAFVYGLFLEGGRFNRNTLNLEDSLPRQLLDSLPCIWLKPVIAEAYRPVDCYECPLYKTSIRAGTLSTTGHSTNFVVTLAVPSQLPQDHWVRRGCAMLCMRDD
jgi:dynein heavy chain, axonemal